MGGVCILQTNNTRKEQAALDKPGTVAGTAAVEGNGLKVVTSALETRQQDFNTHSIPSNNAAFQLWVVTAAVG